MQAFYNHYNHYISISPLKGTLPDYQVFGIIFKTIITIYFLFKYRIIQMKIKTKKGLILVKWKKLLVILVILVMTRHGNT